MAIDYTSSDLDWSQTCLAHFAAAIDQAGRVPGKSSAHPFSWDEPPSFRAVLHLADALLGTVADGDSQQIEPRVRSIVEHAVWSIANRLLEGIRDRSVVQEPESTTLFRAMAAQRGALLYRRFHSWKLRHTEGVLLQTMLTNPVRAAVVLGVDLLVGNPPSSWQESSLAIGSLAQSNSWMVNDVFPRLLDSADPAVLAPALDLANHSFCERGWRPHPAQERFEPLLGLLGAVVSRLAMMEEDPTRFSQTVPEIQRILFDSVSLTVSLCHTMALLGDHRAIGKLNQAMELGHRRIRAEAAYALVRLGEQSAVERLLELADDDANRPRILAYAEELGVADRLRPEWLSNEARARSMLALHLSQPEHFSIAPHHIELLEQRRVVLPGFDEPQACYLFQYTYAFGDQYRSQVAFVGPFVHLLSSDVTNVDPELLFELVLQSLEE
jgi:hypothetical protein